MSFDASQAFKYAMDFTLAVPSILGISQYACYLINITNDIVNYDDTGSGKTLVQTRLLMADGYRSYAAPDGYLNPMIQQESGEQIVLSNGQLTANTLLLGPLVFPYVYNNFSGGIDSLLFQPALGSNSNTQIYIQLRGFGLSPVGNFFLVKEVRIADMANLSYRLLLEATLTNPLL